ncbi:N-acetylmuramoyl-L-alanine amidase-like domain-containing protein [Corallococcus sp. Z5C101001]|uniref:N-acetylmuramoyl-L-alanine amidase-like domain-containing protein n=2 Tax=Corallococcus TaxID=83461 RepID=UPI002107246D|nr:N-acetylmuramoyl-L-alanine amidase-like domain-containing protein [Corallococcus sp. Z5C101001]
MNLAGVCALALLAQAPAMSPRTPTKAVPTAPAPMSPVRENGWTPLTPEQRAALIADPAEAPLAERLLGMSERFLNTPYVLSPLGEGQGVDPDPPFRLDAVDCLTFVEETLALSMAHAEPEVPALLERIRYASTPSYEDRNHLMEAQWLPNNIKKGLLVDVTRQYAKDDSVAVTKTLTARTWQSKSSMALQLPRERQPVGTFTLNMIPLEKVLTHAREVPSGTILVVMREDLPQKATRITHLGFVVQKKKRTYLRHASKGGYNRVVDEDLETFLARNARYDKWRVTGVSLFEARRPPATLASQPAPARGRADVGAP